MRLLCLSCMVAALGSMPADDENGWVVIAALRMFGSRARTVDAPVLSRLGLCFQNLSESFYCFCIILTVLPCIILPCITLYYYITISDLSMLKDLKELKPATRKRWDVQLAVLPSTQVQHEPCVKPCVPPCVEPCVLLLL